jgi:subtilisin family serine protease
MRRALVVITVSLVAISASTGASATVRQPAAHTRSTGASIDPVVQARLAAAASGDLIDVVVVMKARADLSTIPGSGRKRRLAALEQRLRAAASTSQAGLLNLLSTRERAGLVSRYEPLWIFNGVEVEATPSVIRELAARRDVQEIQPNLTLEAPTTATEASTAQAEPNVSLVNAPAMWELGYRGQGIVVANMDTGVDVSHPELASRWRGGTNSWYDPNGQHPTTPTDVNGHGTWTMGAMVGGGAGGTSIGVSPDAKWIAVKIFNDHGTATSTGIHLGFQWLLDPDGDPATADAPNVVNNSWTMSFGCNLDFELDLQSLRAAGILPVFAAGNDGPTAGTSESPANSPSAFAVGSTNGADIIDPSSSRGPSACAQPVYPQLVAPGVGIRTTDLYGGYASETGTSMAAPHVAAALALLLDAFPGMSADRQAAALEGGALDLGATGSDNTYGYGRLDVLASYDWILATPDFTLAASPTTVSVPPGGTATYAVSVGSTNGFSGDVALSLSGLAGSQAEWVFSPALVTEGSGTSQLIVATAATLAPGTYPLTVIGTSGGVAHTTTVSLVVPSPPDFSIAVTPASQSITVGSTATFAVSVTSIDGFADDVSLSVAGLPAGVGTASASPSLIGGAGTAQLSVTTSPAAPAATYPLTVTGTSGSLVHSASLVLVVTLPPDFSLSATPVSRNVPAGTATSFAITAGAVNGFAGNVALSLTGLPANVGAATFSPLTITGGTGSSQLMVTTAATAPPGTYALSAVGMSGSLSHAVSLSLTVTAAPDFAVSISPTSITITRGRNATATVRITSFHGFTGAVTLSLSGLGSGATVSFQPNPVMGSGTSMMTIRTTSKATRGAFTLTLRASSGAVTHKVTVKLTVR